MYKLRRNPYHRRRILRTKAFSTYYEGGSAIYAATEPGARFDFDRIVAYRYDFLRNLKNGDFGKPELKTSLALSAIVRCDIAQDLARKNHEEAVNQVEVALDEAFRSDHDQAIFQSLREAAEIFQERNINEALHYAQLALHYAWDRWPLDYISILKVLAHICMLRPETLDRAILAWDAILLVCPYETHVRLHKFNMGLRFGNKDIVVSATDLKSGSFESIADSACAHCALKQYDFALSLATSGKTKASAEGDNDWTEIFDSILRHISRLGAS